MLNNNHKLYIKLINKHFSYTLESLRPHYNIITSYYKIILNRDINITLDNLKYDTEFIYFDDIISNILNSPYNDSTIQSNKLINFHKIKTNQLIDIIQIDKSNKYIQLFTIKQMFYIYNTNKKYRNILCKKLFNLFNDTQLYEKLFISYLILSQSSYIIKSTDINIHNEEYYINNIQIAKILIDIIYLYDKRDQDEMFNKFINFYLKITNNDIILDIYKILKLKRLSIELTLYFINNFYISYIHNKFVNIKNNDLIDYEELINNNKFFKHIRNIDIFISYFENNNNHLRLYKVIKYFEFFIIDNINKIDISLISRIMILVKNNSSELFYIIIIQRYILLLQNKIDIDLNEFIILYTKIYNIGYYKYNDELIEIFKRYINDILNDNITIDSKITLLKYILSIDYDIDKDILNNLCDEILSKCIFKIDKLKLISLLIINHKDIRSDIKSKADKILYTNTSNIPKISDFEINIGNQILPSNKISQKIIGPFIIDYFQEPNICIEINGPSHFIGDSSIYTFNHILKTKLLEQMGYKIINISYKDYNLI